MRCRATLGPSIASYKWANCRPSTLLKAMLEREKMFCDSRISLDWFSDVADKLAESSDRRWKEKR